MKKPNQRRGRVVDPGDVWPFVAVAVQASQRQIVQLRFTAMLASDDVVNVERQRIHRRRKMAVFATFTRAGPDLLGEVLG
jgi:hypothetical protein